MRKLFVHPRGLISVFVIRCLDSIIPPFFYIRNFKPLASLCGCAGRFESYLVANLEDGFSRDEAHILQHLCYYALWTRKPTL